MPCRAHPVQPMRGAKDIQCALFCSCFRTKEPAARHLLYLSQARWQLYCSYYPRRYKTVARPLFM